MKTTTMDKEMSLLIKELRQLEQTWEHNNETDLTKKYAYFDASDYLGQILDKYEKETPPHD